MKKATKIQIEAIQFSDGKILIGKDAWDGTYVVKTSDGFTNYTKDEMIETFGTEFTNLDK